MSDTPRTDTERLDWLDAQRKWGDGFAVQELDTGDAYVRPWRYALQDNKTFSHIKCYTNIRAAIDSAMHPKSAPVETQVTEDKAKLA